MGVAVSGQYAYLASEPTSPLAVIDISNPTSPFVVGTVDTLGNGIAVAVSGSYAYVGTADFSFQVIDIANPVAPTIVGNIYVPGTSRGVVVSGSYAYVAADSGLQVVDVTNPALPVLVGSVATSGGAQGIAIQGSYAYIADYVSGLQVIDITNPASPVIVGNVDTPGEARGVAILGSYAYVADGDYNFQVIDISNPALPILVGSVNTPGGAYKVAGSGSYVYVADDPSGLTILPTQCGTLTSVRLSSFRASSQPGAVALEWATSLESDFSGFRIQRSVHMEADYRPVGPTLISPPSPYRFLDTDVTSGVTYYYRLEALDRSGRTELFGPVMARLDPTGSLRPVLEQSRPNPTTGDGITIPFSVAQSGLVKLRILDLSGRQVRVLMSQRLDAGRREVRWNGRDDAGRVVPSGVYLYELEAPGFRVTRRMVKLR